MRKAMRAKRGQVCREGTGERKHMPETNVAPFKILSWAHIRDWGTEWISLQFPERTGAQSTCAHSLGKSSPPFSLHIHPLFPHVLAQILYWKSQWKRKEIKQVYKGRQSLERSQDRGCPISQPCWWWAAGGWVFKKKQLDDWSVPLLPYVSLYC